MSEQSELASPSGKAAAKQQQPKQVVKTSQLLSFFLPLGLSSTLVTISHVIINSTLARAPNPEFIIASYAIPLSFTTLTERPLILLRQTCSALVRDRVSFRALSNMSLYIFASIILLCLLIAYTPLGEWVFLYLFGVDDALLQPIIQVYRVLMFVAVFSGIRGLYHGIIISNMRTKWLTIGMIFRLAAMYGLSLYFIHIGLINGIVGAFIFLVGMMIEAAMAVWEGRKLLRKVIPEKKADHPITSKKPIFQFYRPLLFSSFLAAIIGPAINAMLGKTSNIELAIASFSIATSVNMLVLSFFSYLHQIILNFYRKDAQTSKRFVFIVAWIPGILSCLLGFTAIGPFILTHVMGVSGDLLTASLHTLRILALFSLIFPWIDICNGYIMLIGQTKAMFRSQVMNVITTVTLLVVFVFLAPGWNGMIGAIAQSLGLLAELVVLLLFIRSLKKDSAYLSP
ncbi:multi antimicrobial extrusion protein MatE [Paenibacillus yanchengensis]|uniref:Multi antimicrobial extrusion protein MatE n=1 Tax=Paenibacillus yanchengensis TaxID=2035833 RepID=A0ABW4YIK5_9BACL